MEGKRIVITGLTGQVGKPVAKALASTNEVIGVARFSNPAVQAELEAAGVRCVTADLGEGDLSAVPADVDHVVHFAVAKSRSFDADLRANAEGTGRLMSHCRTAASFLHCSSTAVYQPDGHRAFAETDALGDNHRVPTMGFMPTYSTTKIATEAVVRFCAREFGLPTTIARLNVPYGHSGGWPWLHLEQVLAGQPVPVHTDAPSTFNPIHDDDILAMVPRLLEVASTPATIVNWAGVESASIEDWCTLFAELCGREATFEHRDDVLQSVAVDTTRMVELVGPTSVGWRQGMRRMVEHFHPEAIID